MKHLIFNLWPSLLDLKVGNIFFAFRNRNENKVFFLCFFFFFFSFSFFFFLFLFLLLSGCIFLQLMM